MGTGIMSCSELGFKEELKVGSRRDNGEKSKGSGGVEEMLRHTLKSEGLHNTYYK
jgi:hypothetical protein